MDKSVRSVLLATLLCWCSVTACARDGVPAFKVITPSGNESILIGSVHVPYAGLRQPDPSVLDGAAHLVVEHVIPREELDLLPAPEVVKAYPLDRKRRANWAQSVTDEQVERVISNVGCAVPNPRLPELIGIVFQARSPRTAATYAYVPCLPRGELSRDQLLNKAAEERHVSVVPLETPEQILARRRLVPDRIYAAQVMLGLKTDLPRLYGKLVDAFNAGDFDAVASMVNSEVQDAQDRTLYLDLMVTGRNRSWMPTLRAMVDEGRAVVVVGGAHLPGDDGLVALLKRDGYRVEPMALPAIDSHHD